tara:strand:+ start:99 stop:263 length:165 start_codon:yes stop_codon:yes gene_type:complete
MSNKITEKQIIAILENNLINFISNKEIKKIVFNYAFGEKFMKSNNKGERENYYE